MAPERPEGFPEFGGLGSSLSRNVPSTSTRIECSAAVK